MALRDQMATLRSLCGELGYELVQLPNRDSWKLVDEKTGEPLMNPVILAPGFKTADALRYLAKIKRQRDRQSGPRI